MVVGSNPAFEHRLKWHVQSSSVGRARINPSCYFLKSVSVRSEAIQRRGLGRQKASVLPKCDYRIMAITSDFQSENDSSILSSRSKI